MLAVSKAVRVFLMLILLASLSGMIIQGVFHFTTGTAGRLEKFIRFFSYFTILTNIIVTICCVVLLAAPTSRIGLFFSQADTLTAITVYIVVVGLIYNIILLPLSNYQGWQIIGDVLVHSVTPALFLCFWIGVVPKKKLRWKSALSWLLYPCIYTVVVMLRGALSGFYPYPFLNAGEAGYPAVLRNGILICLTFLVLNLLFIGIGKMLAKNDPHRSR